jgi:hypothetical protein
MANLNCTRNGTTSAAFERTLHAASTLHAVHATVRDGPQDRLRGKAKRRFVSPDTGQIRGIRAAGMRRRVRDIHASAGHGPWCVAVFFASFSSFILLACSCASLRVALALCALMHRGMQAFIRHDVL